MGSEMCIRDSQKTFKVALRLNGMIIAEAEGRSKKAAEQRAAKEAFVCLTGNADL